MRTLKFFAVCLLALGIIGMCSAKAPKQTVRVPTHEDFCNDAILALMAKYKYTGTKETLEEMHKNGHMMDELNPKYVNRPGKKH